MLRFVLAILFYACYGNFNCWAATVENSTTLDATELVHQANQYWRGSSSYTELTMQIHRPEWQREMSLISWTEGEDKSLVRFTKPVKNAGNATLKRSQDIWLFNPKLAQVIKLPFSMMAQAWMGSDFSYNDLAKSDQLEHQYNHHITQVIEQDGHKIYVVESIPKANAAVVWGKLELRIRDDHILLAQTFFDQGMTPVKRLQTLDIKTLGGKLFPVTMQMINLQKVDHYTQLRYQQAVFDITLPSYIFSQSNLRNPRPWSLP